MSIKPTIVVVVLAVIGVAAVVVLRRGGPEGPSASVETLPALRSLPVDAIDGIVVERRGQPPLAFARGDEGWAQTEPFDHPMDPFSIRQLAAQAGQVEVVKGLAPGELAGIDLGLDPPRAVLRYRSPQEPLNLEFGRRAVAGRWYLRVADEPTV
jgi:hypothetical protein